MTLIISGLTVIIIMTLSVVMEIFTENERRKNAIFALAVWGGWMFWVLALIIFFVA